ncbi:chain length determinant protein (polysaccharide antigen chain regulator) [Enterobacter sp. AG5470]|nr:chain length determinant protein (polysaccharide antigen chain regulator) [Enterobacter sp. AG5470]
MTHEKNNAVIRSGGDSEQIDLMDVLMQIWRGKWVVIFFIVLAVVVAGAYLSTAKEKWTSTAIVTLPDVGDIAAYVNAVNILSNDNEEKVLDIQQGVVERFNSAFSTFASALSGQSISGILVIESTGPDNTVPLKVTYQAADAKDAQQKLMQFMQQIDEKVSKDLNRELEPIIKVRIHALEAALATQESMAQEQKTLRLQQISQALIVAKDANITAPHVTQVQSLPQDALFLLGSNALESMIKNESSRPLVFSEDYYKTRQKLLDVQHLAPDATDMHTFRYIMEPTLPLQHDSQRRGITFILAILLGAIAGSGFVLIRNAFRHYSLNRK